jgi:hypothetical protein
MNIIVATLIAMTAWTPVNRNVSKIDHGGRMFSVKIKRGQNYQQANGDWAKKNMDLVEKGGGYALETLASDWQLHAATDTFSFRVEASSGDGLEYELSDLGYRWYNPETGDDHFISFDWTMLSPNPTIDGNVWSSELYAEGVRYCIVASPEGSKTNIVFQKSAIDLNSGSPLHKDSETHHTSLRSATSSDQPNPPLNPGIT